jgi:hypothetical protein
VERTLRSACAAVLVTMLLVACGSQPGTNLAASVSVQASTSTSISGGCLASDSPEECSQRQDFAPARPRTASDVLLTQSQAEDLARKAGPTASDAPVRSELLSYADFVKRLTSATDPLIDPSRPIWLVTVYAPTEATMSRPPSLNGATQAPITVDKYSVGIDAVSHFLFVKGFGADGFAQK